MEAPLKRRYMQTRVTPEEYKKIRKKAVDLSLDVETLIKEFVLERIAEEETKAESTCFDRKESLSSR